MMLWHTKPYGKYIDLNNNLKSIISKSSKAWISNYYSNELVENKYNFYKIQIKLS
jgi:hypothetical protein